MKTTKGGKVMNPTDAFRKQQRKKELKRVSATAPDPRVSVLPAIRGSAVSMGVPVCFVIVATVVPWFVRVMSLSVDLVLSPALGFL
jgi:hypothetical protein